MPESDVNFRRDGWIVSDSKDKHMKSLKFVVQHCPFSHCVRTHPKTESCGCSCNVKNFDSLLECPVFADTLALRWKYASENILRASIILNTISDTANNAISHGLLCFECGQPRTVQHVKPVLPLQTTIPTKMTTTSETHGASVDQICAILRETGLGNIDDQVQERIRVMHSA